jgi:hypothetical protein
MKPCLFLVYSDPMSIKRFLLVADALSAEGIPCVFLEFSPERESTQVYFRELNLCHMPSQYRFDDFRRPWDKLEIAVDRFRRWVQREPELAFDRFGEVNLDEAIRSSHRSAMARFTSLRRAAARALHRIEPMAVVYDIELLMPFAASAYEAQCRKIPVISMQHAEGWTDQYSRLPLIADLYVAYSPYNHEILRKMGAAEEKIWLTGAPETDVLFRLNPTEVIADLVSQFGCKDGNQRLLVPLRPSSSETLRNMNRALLQKLITFASGRPNLEILVKEHPNDYIGGPRLRDYLDFSKHENLKVIPADYSVTRLLKASNFLLTYKSAVIVEAVMVGIPMIVLDDDHNALWPNWHDFQVYEAVRIEDMEEALERILFSKERSKNEENRQRFISYFRYQFDSQACNRIAERLTSLIPRPSK